MAANLPKKSPKKNIFPATGFSGKHEKQQQIIAPFTA
jgi:hypothetical protein